MDELNKQSSDSLNQQKSKEDPSSGTELDELNEEPSLEWQEDPRVSFSKLTGKWTLEDEQGNEFEYDGHLKKWILIPDEEAIKQQQLAYVDSKKEVDKPPSRPRKRHRQSDSVDSIKERKQGKVFSPEESNTNSDNNDNANMEKDSNENNNRPSTGIYITNLPPETTEIELEEIFARYGVIAEDLETGEKRIKLYRDENGKLKGDALIIYFKPDSVKLAIEMMDDTRLHFHDKLAIRVQIADRSYKRSSQEKPKLSKQQKTKLQKKIEKLNE